MKKHNMIKILFAILLFAAGGLFAENIPLVTEAKSPKISTRFYDSLQKLSGAADSVKIWVLFTDKGIFSRSAYRAALNKINPAFSDKSYRRRVLRKSSDQPFDFYDIPVNRQYISILESLGFSAVRQSRWLNAVSGYILPENLDDLAELSFVAEIRPVASATRKPFPEVYKPQIPQDVDFEIEDYGLSIYQYAQVNILPLHAIGLSGNGVTIALFDTGFDLDHPAFDSITVIGERDYVDDDFSVTAPLSEEMDHGTKVLSILGGFAPGDLIGPAYGADYLLARTEIESTEIQLEEDNWVAAAEWADSAGADIISSSLGYIKWYDYSDLDGNTALITIAADLAVSRGIAVFISAGNEGNKTWHYVTPPADGDSVIAVGAVDNAGNIAAFSSYGPTYDGRIKPEIMAMGISVYCVLPGTDDFTYVNGTSASTPIAAGAGALMLEGNPSLTPVQMREALIETADNSDNPNNHYGYGIINAYGAAFYLRFDPISSILLAAGDSLDQLITVSGLVDSIPTLTAENIPPTAVFTDNGDRTADFRYRAVEEDIGAWVLRFIAASGGIADTMDVRMTIMSQNRIIAGPNPFTDSVTIFISQSAGQAAEISIFAVNGEKIWDRFADNYDGTSPIVWQGVNNKGEKVASGVYLVYIRTESAEETLKLFKK